MESHGCARLVFVQAPTNDYFPGHTRSFREPEYARTKNRRKLILFGSVDMCMSTTQMLLVVGAWLFLPHTKVDTSCHISHQAQFGRQTLHVVIVLCEYEDASSVLYSNPGEECHRMGHPAEAQCEDDSPKTATARGNATHDWMDSW